MNLINVIKKSGKKLLTILFWPFSAFIEILNFIVEFFNSCGRGIKWLINRIIKLVKKTFNELEETINKKKRWKKLLVLLGKITTTNTNLMHGYILGGITGVLVILLQAISFFTTYGGTSYYFSDIGKWVPFVFAFVIQCTVVTFSLRSSDKTRHKFPQKLVLSLAVIVSILFSYVGTINSAIEPYEEFSNDYRNFEESVSVFKEKALDDKSVALSDLEAIQLINNQIIESQNVLLISNMISSGNVENFDPNKLFSSELSDDNTTVSLSVDDNTKEIIESLLKQEKISSGLNEGINKLESVLYSDNDQTKDCFSLANITEVVNNNNNLDLFFVEYQNLYVATETLNDFLLKNFGEFYQTSSGFNKIDQAELVNKMNNYDTIYNLSISEFETFLNENDDTTSLQNISGFWSKIWTYVKRMFSIKTSAMETYRSIVEKAQKEAFIAHNVLLTTTANSSELDEYYEDLNNKYELVNSAKDATIIAFRRLFDKSTFNRALIPAVLAILVDGGTVIIAWAGQRRKYSYLYANTNRDYLEEEIDLFEEVFIASNGGSGFQEVINNNINKSDDEFIETCHEAVSETINFANNYLKVFKPSPWTVNLGCGIYAPASELEKDPKYNSLTSLLLSLGYIISLNSEEFNSLKQFYDGESEINNSNGLKGDENYYFLRFRVENHLRQNLSSISIYARYLLGK